MGTSKFVTGRRALLCALVLWTALPSALPADGPCDVVVELDVTPRTPPDGGVLTYTTTFCDTTGFGASMNVAQFGVTDARFIPDSGVWIECPTNNCGKSGPNGNMTIGGFEIPPDTCFEFVFTLELQPGQGGDRVCLQGSTNVQSHSPPDIGFTCPKRTDDPTTGDLQDSTCVVVEPPSDRCTIDARIEPTLLATCAGSGEALSAASSTESGCSNGTLTYQWKRNGVDIPGATEVTYPIPVDEPPGGAQYKCLVGCERIPECIDLSNEAQVTVFGSSATVNAPDVACTGETVDVFVQGALSCTIDCGNGEPPVATCTTTCTYATEGTYEIELQVDDGTCQTTEIRTIDVLPAPDACIDLPTELCEQEPTGPTSIALGNCSSPGQSYLWSSSTGILDDPVLFEPTLTLSDVTVATLVTVDLEVTSPGGCGAATTASEVFELLPSPVVTATADPPTACLDEPVRLTGEAAESPGPYTWLWDLGDGTTSPEQSLDKSFPSAGTYDLVLTVTDQDSGCTTLSAPVQVAVEDCMIDCLYRSLVADPATLDPAAVFLDPRDAEDIGLQGPPLQCPVASGFVDPGMIGDGNALAYWQMMGMRTILLRRAEADPTGVEITF